MKIAKRLGLALFLSLGVATSAFAQQSPTSTWNDSVTFRDPFERSVEIQRAEAQERARRGGHGAAQNVTNYEGDVTYNETNEFRGPVTSTTATTATNLNSFSSSVQQDGSNTASITFTTGNTAYNTSQNATASNTSSGSGSAGTTITSTND